MNNGAKGGHDYLLLHNIGKGGRLELKAMQISTSGEVVREELANLCYHKLVWHLLDPLKLCANDAILRFIQHCNHQSMILFLCLILVPSIEETLHGAPTHGKILIACTCLICCRFGCHVSLPFLRILSWPGAHHNSTK